MSSVAKRRIKSGRNYGAHREQPRRHYAWCCVLLGQPQRLRCGYDAVLLCSLPPHVYVKFQYARWLFAHIEFCERNPLSSTTTPENFLLQLSGLLLLKGDR